ncbi:MAG: HAD family phosphatase [Chlamydiae bacterium]|nr:HAD family phosphatase [Chlamydiota bacterium]
MTEATDSASLPTKGADFARAVSNISDLTLHYELLCFDFDGLLVNTEELHFLAYKKMLATYACHLPWDFATYCTYAHANRYALRDAVFAMFSHLSTYDWDMLREEKQRFYEQMIIDGSIQLMPGVQELLTFLLTSSLKYCVVTNSPNNHLEIIKEKIPLLQTIDLWIGRDNYRNPKPHPDPYLSAIQAFAFVPLNKVIAFEDSLKGAQSALKANLQVIFVGPKDHPHIQELPKDRFFHLVSIQELFA